MDRSLGLSFQILAASLGSFVTLSMLISVPMYGHDFVPNPRGITLLQRLNIGFVIQVLDIAITYDVEVRRMRVIRVHQIMEPKQIVAMNIFWLMQQYILLGTADVFNAVGLLEFFYNQSREDMQSLGTTFFTSEIGVGNFLNSFLATTMDKITGRGENTLKISTNPEFEFQNLQLQIPVSFVPSKE